MISQALRIHELAVARHLCDYVLSEKFKPENGGSQSRLSVEQTMQLISLWLRKRTFTPTKLSLMYKLSLASSIPLLA